ncbi:MAG: hypothetical protein H0T60_16130 [Acidobacteria bacterium]|nr:hypothetical protein [Acidobacteriota bacterium]
MSAEEIEAARARMMEEYPARLFEKKVPAGTRVRFQLIYLQSLRAGIMPERGDSLRANDETGRGGDFYDDELGDDEDDD